MGAEPIRPRDEAAGKDLDSFSPPCPWCDGTDTRVLSPFGGQLSVAQCWCHRCRTGFEYIKWEEGEQPAPW